MNIKPASNDPARREAVRQSQFLRKVSTACFTVFSLLLIAGVGLTLQELILPVTLALVGLAVSAAFNLVCISGLRSNQKPAALRTGVWLILVSTILSTLSVPLAFRGSGLIASLAAYFFIIWFTRRTFARRGQLIFLLSTPLLAAAAFAVDFLGSIQRIEPISPLVQYAIIGLELTGIIILLVRRQGEQPFRFKLVGAFILVSAVSVAAVASLSVYLSIQSLSSAGSLALITAARGVAGSVDTFVETMRTRLYADAHLPSVQQFLLLDQPTPEEAAAFALTMDALTSRPALTATSRTSYNTFIRRTLLADEGGSVIFDSLQAAQGSSILESNYFRPAMLTEIPYTSPVLFDGSGQASLFVAARVNSPAGLPLGVLAIEIDPAVLQNIILEANNQAGDQSFAILVDDETGLRLAQGAAPGWLYRVITPLDMTVVSAQQASGLLPAGLLQDLASDETELGRLLQTNYGEVLDLEFSRGQRSEGAAYFAAAATLESRPWRVVYTQTQAAILAPIQTQIFLIAGLAVIVALLAAGAALAISQILVRPVVNLKDLAQKIAAGDLTVRAPVAVEDEIGSLADALNSMTDQLQQNITSLERRVSERTADMQRRGQQLQAAAEIGRIVATLRDQEELLRRSVRLISERFGFYHAGIFLLDASGRYAVLSAANSEGGQRMLARGHRLGVGQQGIVGFVTSTGEPRIALDVGVDAVFFNNPDLPETRSEMALPLRSGGRILGALDVQSTEPQAFTQDDVSTLQVLADLLSVAIDNALLFNETEDALRAIRQAYGEQSRRSWVERVSTSTVLGAELGYIASERGIVELAEETAQGSAGAALSVPIRVRDLVIGSVDIVRPASSRGPQETGSWRQEELDLVNNLVDQLGQALESARLYETSRLQAERERLVGEVSSRLQESLDVDAVLRAAVVEIRQALGLQDVAIMIEPAAGLPAGVQGDPSREVSA